MMLPRFQFGFAPCREYTALMRLWPLTLILMLAPVVHAQEIAVIPQAAPLSEYENMTAKSPFALATAPVAAPTEAPPNFAADWILTGLAQLPNGQGGTDDYVSIRSRDQRISFSLVGAEPASDPDPDVEGVALVRVERGNKLADTYAEIKKGSETAKVKFSEEVTTPPSSPDAASAPAGGAPPMPGATPTVGGGAGPQGVRRSVLGGGGQPVIPRPGRTNPGPEITGNRQPGVGTAPAPPVAPRRRTIINR